MSQALTLTQLDRLVGLSMLIAATTVFLYYTTWTLFMVRFPANSPIVLVLSSQIKRRFQYAYTILALCR